MSGKIYLVDAFTNKPFSGNPAAVCILDDLRNAGWMQKIAAEMNLSETAFLYEQERGYRLRWFTPAVEVELSGHATLASAHILWEDGFLGLQEQARFQTRSGLLIADRRADEIELNFPATTAEPAELPIEFTEALGVSPRYVAKVKHDYLVEVDSENLVRSLTPDFARLKSLSAHAIMVTSVADTMGFDFVSRFFAPGLGIDEDPVTGSAHCCLGPFWGERLGKSELIAYQASARGGTIRVRVESDRVYLGGRAITILRGNLINA